MSLIRLISINLVILFILFFIIELASRVVWTVKSCYLNNCNFEKIKKLKVKEIIDDLNLGLAQIHPRLGYVPTPNFDANINILGWPNVRVTINKNGYRINNNNENISKEILVVGDSFTFGDQVSNKETWPACLEKELSKGVANGGVFGYGAAQSLMRAEIEMKRHKYNTLILSMVVEADFDRDTLDFRSGFPRPAVIKINENLEWANPPDEMLIGTKFNPKKISKSVNLLKFLRSYSFIFSALTDRLVNFGINIDWSGSRLNRVHKNAASVDEIIDWTLLRFSKIDIKHKFLLLQYGEDHIKDEFKLDRRSKVMNLISKLNLNYIDTLEVLKEKNKSIKLWNGHHTPEGNNIVCQLVSKEINFSLKK